MAAKQKVIAGAATQLIVASVTKDPIDSRQAEEGVVVLIAEEQVPAEVSVNQVVSGVAAIPLAISAEAGKVSGELSDELWKAANSPIGSAPLPVADELITVGPPPGEALRKSEKP